MIARKNDSIIEDYDIICFSKSITGEDIKKFKVLFTSPEIDLEKSFVATYDLEN